MNCRRRLIRPDLALVCAVVLGATGCAAPRAAQREVLPTPASDVSDRLYFGQSIPGGDTVSSEAWSAFLRDVVTTRFPRGLTVWRAEGQWLEQTGVLVREPVIVVEIIHGGGTAADSLLEFIAAEYKRRFRQEAVLRVTTPARLRLNQVLVPQVSAVAQTAARAARYPAVYEYRYEFNTKTLVENHYIVLDSVGDRLRGWYYGTSDDFDSAREGYPPGFFVAEMENLAVGGGRISFTLPTPVHLFTRPVPIEYRTSSELYDAGLKRWTQPISNIMKTYAGTLTSDRITLHLERSERGFARMSNRND